MHKFDRLCGYIGAIIWTMYPSSKPSKVDIRKYSPPEKAGRTKDQESLNWNSILSTYRADSGCFTRVHMVIDSTVSPRVHG
jgi:hypothetical protein